MAAQAAEVATQANQLLYTFTGLELFFICTTLLSLFFNLWQFMASRRNKIEQLKPIINSLTGFFNDVKAKTFSLQDTQNMLFHQQNPHTNVDTLRWEYFRFAGSLIDTFRGYQETLVGALITLNPKDPDGKSTFRAADYGLTPREKEHRDDFVKRRQEQQLAAEVQAQQTSSQSEPEPAAT